MISKILDHDRLFLTLALLNPMCPAFANTVDPNQLASELHLHCLPLRM